MMAHHNVKSSPWKYSFAKREEQHKFSQEDFTTEHGSFLPPNIPEVAASHCHQLNHHCLRCIPCLRLPQTAPLRLTIEIDKIKYSTHGDFNHWSKELSFCQGCGDPSGGGIPANALEDPLLLPPGLTIDGFEQNIVALEKL